MRSIFTRSTSIYEKLKRSHENNSIEVPSKRAKIEEEVPAASVETPKVEEKIEAKKGEQCKFMAFVMRKITGDKKENSKDSGMKKTVDNKTKTVIKRIYM